MAGNPQDLLASLDKLDGVIVGIDGNSTRLSLQEMLLNHGASFISLVHPSPVISKYSSIGTGSVVMADAVINPFFTLGQACIVSTCATIDHDCKLPDGVHVSPGVNVAGGCTAGKCSWLGISSKIKQLISIGSNVTIGAGSVVLKDVPDNQTVVGVLAK